MKHSFCVSHSAGHGRFISKQGRVLQSRPAQVLKKKKKNKAANEEPEQVYIRINPVKDLSKVVASESNLRYVGLL